MCWWKLFKGSNYYCQKISLNKKLEISSLYQQWISDGGMNFIESGIIDIPIAFHIIMRDDGYGNVDDGTI